MKSVFLFFFAPFILLHTTLYSKHSELPIENQYTPDTVVVKGYFVERKQNCAKRKSHYGDDTNWTDFVFIPTASKQKFSKKEMRYYFSRTIDSLFFCDDKSTIMDFNSFILKEKLIEKESCDCPYYKSHGKPFKQKPFDSKYSYRTWFMEIVWLELQVLSWDAKFIVPSKYVNEFKELRLFLYLDGHSIED